jgi:hypothetical protein
MSKIMLPMCLVCAVAHLVIAAEPGDLPVGLDDLVKCNVVWTSPSTNSLGSMPIGNGDIGANVWVEPTGDIVLLLSKTDSFDEFNRLLKLGRVRIKTTPSLVVPDQAFEQRLSLKDGTIEIQGGTTTARVWVDANHPVLQVDLRSPNRVEAEVGVEIWRTSPRALNRTAGRERESVSASYNRPEDNRVNPDVVLPHGETELAWCHHNKSSVWRANLELTALGDQVEQRSRLRGASEMDREAAFRGHSWPPIP